MCPRSGENQKHKSSEWEIKAPSLPFSIAAATTGSIICQESSLWGLHLGSAVFSRFLYEGTIHNTRCSAYIYPHMYV